MSNKIGSFSLICGMILLILAYAGNAHAALKSTVLYTIPERYALVQITGANPDVPMPRDQIIESMKGEYIEYNFKHLQYIIYNEGDKFGDGPRIFAHMNKKDVVNYIELTGEDAEIRGKFIESVIGYEIGPKELYKIYQENEFAANEDFKGKPLCLSGRVNQVSQDLFGEPVLTIVTDDMGIFGIQVVLDKSDPFIRKVKKGTPVILRAYTKGYSIGMLRLEGKIISCEDEIFIGGKTVSIKEVSKK